MRREVFPQHYDPVFLIWLLIAWFSAGSFAVLFFVCFLFCRMSSHSHLLLRIKRRVPLPPVGGALCFPEQKKHNFGAGKRLTRFCGIVILHPMRRWHYALRRSPSREPPGGARRRGNCGRSPAGAGSPNGPVREPGSCRDPWRMRGLQTRQHGWYRGHTDMITPRQDNMPRDVLFQARRSI